MQFFKSVSVPVFCVCLIFSGCKDQTTALLDKAKELNGTNVMKIRSCFGMYASRHNLNHPENQTELLQFLQSGEVDKNLERLGIPIDSIESIFVSDRDGKPLKIRWGGKSNPDRPQPIAFETEGVDGVRLVSADTLLEVENDQEYEKLWRGDYKSKLSYSMGDGNK